MHGCGGGLDSDDIAERAAELGREGWRQRDRDVFKTMSVWFPPPLVAQQAFTARTRRLDEEEERAAHAVTFSEGMAGSDRRPMGLSHRTTAADWVSQKRLSGSTGGEVGPHLELMQASGQQQIGGRPTL